MAGRAVGIPMERLMTVLTVGQGQQFARLSDAIAAAANGDLLQVQAGTYANDFATINKALIIEGVGGMVRLVAKPAPYTMTQEYQEETNEFLKVRCLPLTTSAINQLTRTPRTKNPIPSLVSPLLVTPARVWSSLLPRQLNSIHNVVSFVLEAWVTLRRRIGV